MKQRFDNPVCETIYFDSDVIVTSTSCPCDVAGFDMGNEGGCLGANLPACTCENDVGTGTNC